MSRSSREQRTLQREALVMRAALQRRQLAAVFEGMRPGPLVAGSAGRLALGLARSLIGRRPGGAPLTPKPWMLSAALILVRALRASPTARWLTGAATVGAAIWWVARALRSGPPGDESG